jgi:hypothetical protein
MFESFDVNSTFFVAAVISVLVAFVALRNDKARDLSRTALDIAERLEGDVQSLRDEVSRLKRTISELRNENTKLWRWGTLNAEKVRRLGGEPTNYEDVE